jgi:hypothetical protein
VSPFSYVGQDAALLGFAHFHLSLFTNHLSPSFLFPWRLFL